MALPLILVPIMISSAIKGTDSIVNGMNNLKSASSLSKELEVKYKLNIEFFERQKNDVTKFLDKLGKKELKIFETFAKFAIIMERIQNKPVFKKYSKEGFIIPEYNPKEIKKLSLSAALVLGGLGSAAAGTAGGIAAGGAATTLISALGIASTGTAISSLNGIAATNAIYAALGGGVISAGGGGIAAGTVVLGGTTLGIGLLAGGSLFEKYSESMKDKVQEILRETEKITYEINKICTHLAKLKDAAVKFSGVLTMTNRIYEIHLLKTAEIVLVRKKTDWNMFTETEKLIVQNTVLLVGLLYNLGKIRLLLIPKNENSLEEINEAELNKLIKDTKDVLTEKKLRI